MKQIEAPGTRLSTSEPHHDGAIRDEGDYDSGSAREEEPLGGALRARLSAVEAKNLGVDPLGDVGGPAGVIPDFPRNVERSVWRPEKLRQPGGELGHGG